jgi:hypothetical protein
MAMLNLSYRVTFFLDNEATHHEPERCFMLPWTFGTELEASTAARQALPKVRKQFGPVMAHVMIDELCPEQLPGVVRM